MRLTKEGDESVDARDGVVASDRLHVGGGELQGALELRARLCGRGRVAGRLVGRPLHIGGDIATQPFGVDAQSLHDRARIRIVDQGDQQILRRGVLTVLLGRDAMRALERTLEIRREAD
ncbi:MAG TPA: hypothetical protein VLX44_08995 [Xanthobacteraceae bacterium]|nr:hypothetical protein [Xanthobacteraceae bacterium]